MSQLLKKLFSRKYAVVANVCSLCGLMAAGDVLEQAISSKLRKNRNGSLPLDLNKKRTGDMAVSGIPVAVFAHYWYRFLDGYLPGRKARTIIKKTVMDICIGSIVMNIVWFGTIESLEGKSKERMKYDVKKKLPVIIAGDITFWTPLQALNFLLVPPQFRVVYVGCAELVWIVVLSFIQHEYKEPS